MKVKINKRLLAAGVIGLVLGSLIILAERFITYHPSEAVHYHANFAVYLNGQREQFRDIFYYISPENSCSSEKQPEMNPYERAHMHDNVNDVVHVEDEAVTWGQFFQNLGWVVDPKVIRTEGQILLADEHKKINFMLNGQKVENIVNRVIKDEDRLLIDYGSTADTDLNKEYRSIQSTAHKYDVTPDPESCSGHETPTMRDRLRHMF